MSKTFLNSVTLAVLATLAAACGDGGDDSAEAGSGQGGGSGAAGGGQAGGAGVQASGAGGLSAAGAGGGSDISAAPCYQYCSARETKMDCSATSSIEDCVGYTTGCNDFDSRTTACQTALMGYWSCTAAQANPCDNPGTCTAQANALGSACN
jgi:hypothetical protein